MTMRVLGTVKLLVRCVKCGTSVVSSSEHTHGFQQAPKGVLIQKTWLENHWSVSVFYGLVPASRCTCIANHCPHSSYPSCSDPLSAGSSVIQAHPASEPSACCGFCAPRSSPGTLCSNATSGDGPSLISQSKGPPQSLLSYV